MDEEAGSDLSSNHTRRTNCSRYSSFSDPLRAIRSLDVGRVKAGAGELEELRAPSPAIKTRVAEATPTVEEIRSLDDDATLLSSYFLKRSSKKTGFGLRGPSRPSCSWMGWLCSRSCVVLL